ncbi:alcohol dehydrogenase, putative [Talaromyces stipitatus ATCC 10500]|uniref:Alcohol dehydrogenase, putative n=1 Tax=Talaromyces stipitatus (strain ATCC 10500 / CBS 375.48 / QM 6759 / NRRL 1006) TaxID=441959 RepID=B8LV65_TALSN|nr:alcohol dehydrogenase, putative [Talaromyces stipitatus ATCC 10500]EED23115.1 alcohol dehydrogenase, putative [Talaromyces stipitatus ATCC 10500]
MEYIRTLITAYFAFKKPFFDRSFRHTETTKLLLVQKGGPFEVKKTPQHDVKPDQVLIRQRAIALNGLDPLQRDLGVNIQTWPYVLGVEGAGVIEAIGSEVEGFQVGDEVLAWELSVEGWGGAYQEHVVVPARFVAKKPKNISIEEAASLPICYNAAICTMFALKLRIPIPNFRGASNSEGEPEPKSILVLGGSSVVGASAIQLLRLAYPSVPIFATSSPAHHAHLLSLGATKVFDYHSPTMVSDIKAASPESRGVDMIFDVVGAGASQTDICDTFDPNGIKKYGALVTAKTVTVPEGVTKFESGGWTLLGMPGQEQVIPALAQLVEEGKYKVPLSVKVVGHGLEQIPDVMDQVRSVSGEKLIVTL